MSKLTALEIEFENGEMLTVPAESIGAVNVKRNEEKNIHPCREFHTTTYLITGFAIAIDRKLQDFGADVEQLVISKINPIFDYNAECECDCELIWLTIGRLCPVTNSQHIKLNKYGDLFFGVSEDKNFFYRSFPNEIVNADNYTVFDY